MPMTGQHHFYNMIVLGYGAIMQYAAVYKQEAKVNADVPFPAF